MAARRARAHARGPVGQAAQPPTWTARRRGPSLRRRRHHCDQRPQAAWPSLLAARSGSPRTRLQWPRQPRWRHRWSRRNAAHRSAQWRRRRHTRGREGGGPMHVFSAGTGEPPPPEVPPSRWGRDTAGARGEAEGMVGGHDVRVAQVRVGCSGVGRCRALGYTVRTVWEVRAERAGEMAAGQAREGH